MSELGALLICDRAVRDASTGKWTLEGIFDVVWAERFPAIHQSMDVYLRVRPDPESGGGPWTVALVCRGPDGVLLPASSTPATATLDAQPSGLIETVVRLIGVPFRSPGDYVIEAHVGGRPVGATRLTVAEQRRPNDALH